MERIGTAVTEWRGSDRTGAERNGCSGLEWIGADRSGLDRM